MSEQPAPAASEAAAGAEVAVRRPESLAARLAYARELAEGNLLPAQYRGRPANVLWAVEYGRMLGLAPMAALTGVHVIEGKPTASAALISALVRRAGHTLRVTGNDERAVAQIIRADDPGFTFESVWTPERARQAGLLTKGTWTKYPAAMLKARAVTEVARDACEDALLGLHYTPEELGAELDVEGHVIGGSVEDSVPAEVLAQATALGERARDAADEAALRAVYDEVVLHALAQVVIPDPEGKGRKGTLVAYITHRKGELHAAQEAQEGASGASEAEGAGDPTPEPGSDPQKAAERAALVVELEAEAKAHGMTPKALEDHVWHETGHGLGGDDPADADDLRTVLWMLREQPVDAEVVGGASPS